MLLRQEIRQIHVKHLYHLLIVSQFISESGVGWFFFYFKRLMVFSKSENENLNVYVDALRRFFNLFFVAIHAPCFLFFASFLATVFGDVLGLPLQKRNLSPPWFSHKNNLFREWYIQPKPFRQKIRKAIVVIAVLIHLLGTCQLKILFSESEECSWL